MKLLKGLTMPMKTIHDGRALMDIAIDGDNYKSSLKTISDDALENLIFIWQIRLRMARYEYRLRTKVKERKNYAFIKQRKEQEQVNDKTQRTV